MASSPIPARTNPSANRGNHVVAFEPLPLVEFFAERCGACTFGMQARDFLVERSAAEVRKFAIESRGVHCPPQYPGER